MPLRPNLGCAPTQESALRDHRIEWHVLPYRGIAAPGTQAGIIQEPTTLNKGSAMPNIKAAVLTNAITATK
jgi:hypothetical protein